MIKYYHKIVFIPSEASEWAVSKKYLAISFEDALMQFREEFPEGVIFSISS